ncbi:unnamed protein product [Bursaphelenchus xylophilus]|uniref:GDP-Man:Man(3)GlcNAc(2)-PP-Dol alpha-1,2-mannosyltransferase n=1 Tax=Bursaphelenchus xylophilus TaxID=6326 RepID=A0A1I7STN6_BURXY|nr:unnamed protein product [Bursaphelenchus xylophilus]CAG9108172.1 unnamed protein product [Bursaphelenchus xylophilus]
MILFFGFCAAIAFSLWCRSKRRQKSIAFFHPNCADGGGGEAVLWTAVDEITKRRPDLFVCIFSTLPKSDALCERIDQRFQFQLPWNSIEFMPLKSTWLLNPGNYPYLTLLLQFLAGFFVGLDALLSLNPEIFVETTGVPATLPVFRIFGGCTTVAYVHYPMITKDMINRVASRKEMYNNAGTITKSLILTNLKLLYYYGFSLLYYLCGLTTTKVLTNGTWTKEHLETLWPFESTICYPPVKINDFVQNQNKGEKALAEKRLNVVSLGQIRPEKNHRDQLKTLSLLREEFPYHKICLKIIGSIRNEADQILADELRCFAEELELKEGTDFEFVHNAKFSEILELLQNSLCALHTMVDEHFGIAVVEMLAAGVLVVAHKSAGPLKDIIGSSDKPVGFLGETPEDYANHIKTIIESERSEREKIRADALQWVSQKFDETKFRAQFLSVCC